MSKNSYVRFRKTVLIAFVPTSYRVSVPKTFGARKHSCSVHTKKVGTQLSQAAPKL